MAFVLIDPQSVLDYEFDWSDWLGEGDSISTHAWSISPANEGTPSQPVLTSETQSAVKVSACEVGKVYRLTDHITTTSGLEADRSVILRCEER